MKGLHLGSTDNIVSERFFFGSKILYSLMPVKLFASGNKLGVALVSMQHPLFLPSDDHQSPLRAPDINVAYSFLITVSPLNNTLFWID